jgi:hypothetical protein
VSIGAYRTDQVISTCSYRTRPRLTRANRGALWQNGGSKRRASSESDRGHGLKMLLMRFAFLYSSISFGATTYAWSRLSRSVISLLYLATSSVSRLDVFSWWSLQFGVTRLNPCIAHCSTDSIPWVHHSREEGSLDYDEGFVRLQIHMKSDTNIHRQQAPFSRCWRWNSVNLAMSLPLVLAWILYPIHLY